MQNRAARFAGRQRDHTPTVEFPFVVVLVDEVAFLTAYQTDRKLREPAQADLVLGDGAHDRGALCEEISADPATGAGVGYVRLEASPDPVRVRAGFVTDTDICDMAQVVAD